MENEGVFLGLDVGSVTTKVVAINARGDLLASSCLETRGRPAGQIMAALAETGEELPSEVWVAGVGTTGSGRHLAAALAGGDVVKNEITAHATAALKVRPETRTVLEIGGQDSKIILLRDGVVVDFAMNTVCAAGTGSFLDRQASRLGLGIEEFAELAAGSRHPVRIAGRCTVFAETDMIHKQQVGHPTADIVAGLCRALARNYLNNLAKGKDLEPPYVFQGGVAANAGMVAAFEEELGDRVWVPPHHTLMGAYGAAVIASENRSEELLAARAAPSRSRFRGFRLLERNYRTSAFDCGGCTNECEIIEIFLDGVLVARWGGRCEKWERADVTVRAALGIRGDGGTSV